MNIASGFKSRPIFEFIGSVSFHVTSVFEACFSFFDVSFYVPIGSKSAGYFREGLFMFLCLLFTKVRLFLATA